MKQLLAFFIFAALLSGCAALGTRTLYKDTDIKQPGKIGFAKLNSNTTLLTLFPRADSIFGKAVRETYRKYALGEIISIDFPVLTANVDTLVLAELCKREKLDGLIFSRVKFIHVTYTAYSIPIAKNWDAEVDMHLYDREGKLVRSVRHNTLRGNSYFMPPSADKTIYDGTEGALKQMAKELGWVKLSH